MYIDPVFQESLYQTLLYVKNPYYCNISITINNIQNNLTDLSELNGNLLSCRELVWEKWQLTA